MWLQIHINVMMSQHILGKWRFLKTNSASVLKGAFPRKMLTGLSTEGREGWEEWGRDFWSCFCCLDSSPAHVVGPCLARMLWFLRQRQLCSGWEDIPSLFTLFLLSASLHLVFSHLHMFPHTFPSLPSSVSILLSQPFTPQVWYQGSLVGCNT